MMLLKLRTNFTKDIMSKVISKTIRKKIGYKIDVRVQDLDIEYVDGKAVINTNLVMKLDGEDLKELILNSI